VSYDPLDIVAAQEHFGFASPAPIEKDWYILRAMHAIASVDAGPFHLVFAGGTCLARAHRLVRRMTEDVDFKVAPSMPRSSATNSRHIETIRRLRRDGLLRR
jgi:predicted nucleotidyltransferase component of viral defense system